MNSKIASKPENPGKKTSLKGRCPLHYVFLSQGKPLRKGVLYSFTCGSLNEGSCCSSTASLAIALATFKGIFQTAAPRPCRAPPHSKGTASSKSQRLLQGPLMQQQVALASRIGAQSAS